MRINFKHSEETKQKIREHNLSHPRRYWLGKKREDMIGNSFASGDIENIQPLCSSCNLKKFTKVIDFRINDLIKTI